MEGLGLVDLSQYALHTKKRKRVDITPEKQNKRSVYECVSDHPFMCLITIGEVFEHPLQEEVLPCPLLSTQEFLFPELKKEILIDPLERKEDRDDMSSSVSHPRLEGNSELAANLQDFLFTQQLDSTLSELVTGLLAMSLGCKTN
eukprot:TRINITY_DN3086_c0_g2_i1.p1 TRINITY_DN3086_c0_g2~~TRINITY_DN3086_c0_g2_i1.p1  ORF type:complete len:145 (-),score=28.68 TRINITY_DN3086_c0_g2_i1:48-482(-)